ncbi:MAG: alpha/beta fold hydrolase, partial [Gammaproteobacteria bacterium]|nr:alpha/beta fold hydrolase [Gammaproteobacteria bacterium]
MTFLRLLPAVLLGLLGPTVATAAPAFEDCRLEAGPGQQTIGARCTRIAVPLDHTDPGSERLELFVARVPALTPNPKPDPLTVIAGGPGQASSEFFAALAGAFGRIQRDRDILVVDQRGTGRSLRLDCDLPDDPAALELAEESLPQLLADCLAMLPADPRHFTTSAAVRDLDIVRERLGIPSLNVYGVSYGTRVAQHYARRFPERTRTLILDAVVPADVPLGPDIAPFAQQSLDAMFARCADTPACAERFPALDSRLGELLDSLEQAPATLVLADPLRGHAVERTLTAMDVRATLRLLSYAPETVALLPLLISQAAEGHLTPLRAQVDMVLGQLDEMLAMGMHNAVVCTEDLPRVTVDEALLAPLRETYLGDQQLRMLARICQHWPAGLLDDDLHEPLSGDVPTLVLSGELDPITPPAYGERVMATLTRARHLVAPGQGHG